jgi:hypothetical protein
MSGYDDPGRWCQYCRCDLDHPDPSHSSNCPAYDGPTPEPEGMQELRDKVDLVCEALAYIVSCLPTVGNAWGDEARDLAKRLRE